MYKEHLKVTLRAQSSVLYIKCKFIALIKDTV